MKKFYILPVLGITITTLLGFQRLGTISADQVHVASKFTSGSPGSYTGAPGESTCTNCHGGAVNDGSTENMLRIEMGGSEVFEYTPGATHDLFLTTESNVSKKGFQITALDENDNPAGVFIASTNTKLLNGSGGTTGRKYATHNAGTNAPNGWDFSWTAPSNPVGSITFYVATNKSNANGQSSGDVIYLSQHIIGTSAGLIEQTKENEHFMAGYSPANNQVFIEFEQESVGEMFVSIVSLAGNVVFTQKLGKSIAGVNRQKIVLPTTVAAGMHSVNFFVDNKAYSAKIMVVK